MGNKLKVNDTIDNLKKSNLPTTTQWQIVTELIKTKYENTYQLYSDGSLI